jgi:hypothetical protein
MVSLDISTLSLMGTIAASSAASAWWVGRMLRSVEINLSAKLAAHENEDQRIFEEHGLRLQRLEIHGFGFTAAGKSAVSSPLPEPVNKN